MQTQNDFATAFAIHSNLVDAFMVFVNKKIDGAIPKSLKLYFDQNARYCVPDCFPAELRRLTPIVQNDENFEKFIEFMMKCAGYSIVIKSKNGKLKTYYDCEEY